MPKCQVLPFLVELISPSRAVTVLGQGRRMDDGRVGDGAVFQQDAFVLQQAVHGLEEF